MQIFRPRSLALLVRSGPQLFQTGVIETHSKKNNFSYIVNGVKTCALVRPESNRIKYFDRFTLKTKKYNNYLLWKQLHDHIQNKNHLDPKLRPFLKQLAARVNSTGRHTE